MAWIEVHEELRSHPKVNLPARVCEYRAAGVNVDDVWIETHSGKRVKEYFIPRVQS
jgi:hypothetical protein